MYYLYKIHNSTKNKSYIGITKNPKARKTRHFCGCGSPLLAKDIKDNLIFEILVAGTYEYIEKLEPKAIELYNSMTPYGYNQTEGGECGPSLRGSLNSNSKLTEDQVFQIKVLYAEGWTAVDLAVKFKISRQTIGTIVREENWRHVKGPIVPSKRKLVSEQESRLIKQLSKKGLNYIEIGKQLNRSPATILNHI